MPFTSPGDLDTSTNSSVCFPYSPSKIPVHPVNNSDYSFDQSDPSCSFSNHLGDSSPSSALGAKKRCFSLNFGSRCSAVSQPLNQCNNQSSFLNHEQSIHVQPVPSGMMPSQSEHKDESPTTPTKPFVRHSINHQSPSSQMQNRSSYLHSLSPVHSSTANWGTYSITNAASSSPSLQLHDTRPSLQIHDTRPVMFLHPHSVELSNRQLIEQSNQAVIQQLKHQATSTTHRRNHSKATHLPSDPLSIPVSAPSCDRSTDQSLCNSLAYSPSFHPIRPSSQPIDNVTHNSTSLNDSPPRQSIHQSHTTGFHNLRPFSSSHLQTCDQPSADPSVAHSISPGKLSFSTLSLTGSPVLHSNSGSFHSSYSNNQLAQPSISQPLGRPEGQVANYPSRPSANVFAHGNASDEAVSRACHQSSFPQYFSSPSTPNHASAASSSRPPMKNAYNDAIDGSQLVELLMTLSPQEFKCLMVPFLPALLTSREATLVTAEQSSSASTISTKLSINQQLYQHLTHQRNRWSFLQSDLLIIILSMCDLATNLLATQLVNHHWKKCCQSPIVYRHVGFEQVKSEPVTQPNVPVIRVRNDRDFHLLCRSINSSNFPIQSMRLTGCTLTSLGVSSLRLVQQSITHLDLSMMAPVDDAAVLAISRLKFIARLSLCGTNITNQSMRYLRCLKHLTHLGLMYTRVNEDCVSEISQFEALENLAVCVSKWSLQSIQSIGQCATLRRLQLDCIPMRCISALKHLTQLTTLDFAVKPPPQRLSHSTLHLTQHQANSPVFDLSPIIDLINLRKLSIHFEHGCWDFVSCPDFFGPINQCVELSSLQLDGCPFIRDLSLAGLSVNHSLRSLQFDADITDQGIVNLLGLCGQEAGTYPPSSQTVKGFDTLRSSTSSFPSIRQSINALSIASSLITDVGVELICQSVDQLMYLHIAHARLTALSVECFGRYAQLANASLRIAFESMKMCDAFIDALAELLNYPSIAEVQISRCCMTDVSAEKVLAHPKLRANGVSVYRPVKSQ